MEILLSVATCTSQQPDNGDTAVSSKHVRYHIAPRSGFYIKKCCSYRTSVLLLKFSICNAAVFVGVLYNSLYMQVLTYSVVDSYNARLP